MTIQIEANYNITDNVLINDSEVVGIVTMIGLQNSQHNYVRYYVEWMDKNNVVNRGWFNNFQLKPPSK
jgi:hypothetical protein